MLFKITTLVDELQILKRPSFLSSSHQGSRGASVTMAKAAENGEDLQTSNINRASEEDKPTKLQDLVAQATLKYSVKDYDAAAELYAYATELQAEINGEMSPENADLLYAYGRCLYHVAVKNSDVLGSKVAGEAKDEGTKATAKREQKAFKQETQIQGDDAGNADGLKGTSAVPEDSKPEESSGKPFFQFTGDENFDTSEDEEGGEEDGEEGGGVEEKDTDEEEDDFVVAFEVLDLARLLLQKKIEETEASQGKGKEFGESTGVRQLKERLADTYDLQAEISLEGERFPSAVIDLKSSLELKKALYPQESSLIAEAHFKLSLALEFSSVTQQKDENGEVRPGTEAQVDEAMREEAASELEAAISSCNLRISKEESRLKEPALTQENGEDGKRKATKDEINEVKEMVKDLQQRVSLTGCC